MRESYKHINTKWLIIVICSTLLSTIGAILITSNSQAYIIHWLTTLDNNIMQIYPSEDIAFKNYKINGSNFMALNNDPQIYTKLSEKNAGVLIAEFNEPLVQDINISIYYAGEDQSFSQERTVSYVTQKGRHNVIIKLPSFNYSQLRIDIGDQTNIQFDLKSISIIDNIRYFKYLNPVFVSSAILIFGFSFISLVYIMKSNYIKNKFLIILLTSIFISCFIWIITNFNYKYNIEISTCFLSIITLTLIIVILIFEVDILVHKYSSKFRGVL